MLLDEQQAEELKNKSLSFKSITLSRRQLCDLELLLNGGFDPLAGFMHQADYESVLETMKLADGSFWPMPITLDIPAQLAEQLEIGERLALRDAEGFMPAVLKIEEKWQPDKLREARQVYGTDSAAHPGIPI